MFPDSLLAFLRRFDVLAFLVCIALFLAFPDIDRYISSLFFDPQQGFHLKNHPLVQGIYKGTGWVMGSLLVGMMLLFALSFLPHLRERLPSRRTLGFLICAALLGPGLLVNATLKENWNRPRPAQTVDFGGQYTFSPALTPGSECQRCLSFVSGHASAGFYLFAFALLSCRRRWLCIPVLAGVIIGGIRIMQGGHFLGDVLFSGWVVWFSSYLLYWLFYRRFPYAAEAPQPDPRQQQARAGLLD
jgi:lipid A 4'-phosphatase